MGLFSVFAGLFNVAHGRFPMGPSEGIGLDIDFIPEQTESDSLKAFYDSVSVSGYQCVEQVETYCFYRFHISYSAVNPAEGGLLCDGWFLTMSDPYLHHMGIRCKK